MSSERASLDEKLGDYYFHEFDYQFELKEVIERSAEAPERSASTAPVWHDRFNDRTRAGRGDA
jgi:hypothetical protein